MEYESNSQIWLFTTQDIEDGMCVYVCVRLSSIVVSENVKSDIQMGKNDSIDTEVHPERSTLKWAAPVVHQ